MGQACWRNGVYIKTKFSTLERRKSRSGIGSAKIKADEHKNNRPSTIKDEDGEESGTKLNISLKEKKNVFQIINHKDIQKGIKKLRENKMKTLEKINMEKLEPLNNKVGLFVNIMKFMNDNSLYLAVISGSYEQN